MAQTFREQILTVLSEKPHTVTDLKNKIPSIKSFGTLAYHLKKLEEDHIVTKKKENKQQGQPTKYSIISQTITDAYRKASSKQHELLFECLNFIKNNVNITDAKMKEKDLDIKFGLPLSFSQHDGLIDKKIFLTEKGKQILKENK